jgi:hypothetical protein
MLVFLLYCFKAKVMPEEDTVVMRHVGCMKMSEIIS